MSDLRSDTERIYVKKYGAGQSIAWMEGPAEHADAARMALQRSFTTSSSIMREQFRDLMRAQGVADEVIEVFLRDARIDDESYLADRPR
ncbi:MAG TPA: hypothetical protein VFT29_02445 [Gemmatimonadaceae bacterium]|nr:hypothetical protein [Gemmatimonadaceae bacterium]